MSAVDSWFQPVVHRGRDAAFLDTGFLRALVDPTDSHHGIAQMHFSESSGNFYTTNLVLAELVRQIVKHRQADYVTRQNMYQQCYDLLGAGNIVCVCSPPKAVLEDAYSQLGSLRPTNSSLDLCDALSMVVLNYACHNRILGFDSHFRIVGGRLEP